MKQTLNFIQKKHEKGQVLVILALLFIGLIAIIGLAIDMGNYYVSYAQLRRAVDSAALNATSQFREGATILSLEKSAQEFLKLNGVDHPVSVTIVTCANATGRDLVDMGGCGGMKRKLVLVRASETVPMFFLSVIGFSNVSIETYSVSEAASVDVVLAIDTSESMTYGDTTHPITGVMRDPKVCNESDASGSVDGYPGDCHPFQEVKDAAWQFVDLSMYDGYDRVAIVTFDKNAVLRLPLTSDKKTVKDAIKNLEVYEGGNPPSIPSLCPYTDTTAPNVPVVPGGEPCRLYYTSGNYYGFDCLDFPLGAATGDPSHCTSTNIGGGLRLAGNEFAGHPPSVPMREEALWVVILLTDGAANAGYSGSTPICPHYTWDRNPYCRDTDATAAGRHPDTIGGNPNPLYDADDFARDMADFVAQPDPVGQNAVLFSIGLGSLVTDTKYGDPPAGESLLKYAAEGANPNNKGEYYFAPTGSQLRAIFVAIANKIATRLTR
jgi:hypothetical protein